MNKYAIRKMCIDQIYFLTKYADETDRHLMINNTYLERGMSGFEKPNDDEATIKTKQK